MEVGSKRYIVMAERREQVERMVKDGRGQIVEELPIIDGYVIETKDEGLYKAQVPGVQVVPDRKLSWIQPVEVGPEERPAPQLHLQVSGSTLNNEKVWAEGYTGKGVGVAILDSGVAPHKDFEGRLAVFKDFTNPENDDKPWDPAGHGTHVAGDAAGSGAASGGRHKGAAYEATILGLKIGNEQGPDLSAAVKAIDWALAHKDEHNIRVMNMSFGGPNVDPTTDPLMLAIRKAAEGGIVSVVAAGNEGPWPNSIGSPGDSPDALTVGASDTKKTPDWKDDTLARFSSRGPVPNGSPKPDVVAPGVKINAPDAGDYTGYVAFSGTSMASPVTAGVLATWFQANPAMTAEQAIAIAKETARPLTQSGLGEADQGKGLVDAYAGLQKALALKGAAAAVAGPAGAALAKA